jgi:hypothetical protein
MNMYNYFLKARVSLRTLSSLVIKIYLPKSQLSLNLHLFPHSYLDRRCGVGLIQLLSLICSVELASLRGV